MKYMIHACPERRWYVEGYLLEDMLAQGIPREDITIWMDETHAGNLASCLRSFQSLPDDGGTWHMQDDVLIASDFAKKTKEHDDGIVSGFCRKEWQMLEVREGKVPALFMWNSFQCIRIPNKIAHEFAEWVIGDAVYRTDRYREWAERGKYDDSFFYDFIAENYTDEYVYNIKPLIVEHVDFLLGGSVINKHRETSARGDFWEDEGSFRRLKDRLARR